MDTEEQAPARTDPKITQSALTRRDFIGAAGGLVLAGEAASAAERRATTPQPMARATPLYPHESATRSTRNLSGIWRFRADPQRVGEQQGWWKTLTNARAIPVPCSWNEIFDDLRNYTGTAWYETEFDLDAGWSGKRIHLRFGSVTYRAKVWLNEQLVGEHLGGNLPFVFDVSAHARAGAGNRLVVLVENELKLDRVPAVPDAARVSLYTRHYPQTVYDFFPFSGIHRPVLLFSTPDVHIHDVSVRTTLQGTQGRVHVEVETSPGWNGTVRAKLAGAGQDIESRSPARDARASLDIAVPNARPWSPADPHLYRLSLTLEDSAVRDVYELRIGVREVKVSGDRVLLNGSPVFLRGFGKHEDFPLHGRGLDTAAIIRDFELLKWLGANSFRTSHYPYSDEAMMLADEYGFLVIDETPAVSLVFSDEPAVIDARARQMRQSITEMVARDKNHPCVILWSVANEPILMPFQSNGAAAPGGVEAGRRFFAPLFELFRRLDPTRPVTLVSVQGGPAEWCALGDVICTNSYSGWYSLPGQLDEAAKALEREVLALRARHPNKPIMYTEFGADAVAGVHSQPPEMWSEEYQADMIEMYIRALQKHAFIFGTHPWAFADFRTSQSTLRVGALNQKGVFTRDRRPKLAAHRLRQLWAAKA